MADVTVKRFSELESYPGPPAKQFFYAGKSLGVTAWGMNLMRLPPNWEGAPEHDHSDTGQEEVYVVLEGSATLKADGESWTLKPGTLARIGPNQKRKVIPGDEGVTILALGGTPGKAYQPRK